jgi:hypothetical protein
MVRPNRRQKQEGPAQERVHRCRLAAPHHFLRSRSQRGEHRFVLSRSRREHHRGHTSRRGKRGMRLPLLAGKLSSSLAHWCRSQTLPRGRRHRQAPIPSDRFGCTSSVVTLGNQVGRLQSMADEPVSQCYIGNSRLRNVTIPRDSLVKDVY